MIKVPPRFQKKTVLFPERFSETWPFYYMILGRRVTSICHPLAKGMLKVGPHCSPLKCRWSERFNALLWFSESAMLLYHGLPNTLWEGDTQNLPHTSSLRTMLSLVERVLVFTSDAWEMFQLPQVLKKWTIQSSQLRYNGASKEKDTMM